MHNSNLEKNSKEKSKNIKIVMKNRKIEKYQNSDEK